MAQQPLVCQVLIIIKISRSHSDTPHSVGLLWTSDQPDAETCTWQYNNVHKREIPMPPAGSRWPPDLKSSCPVGARKEPRYTILFSQESRQANPLQVPQRGPYGDRCPYPEPFVTYLPGSPVKEPSPEALRTEPLQREMLHSYSPLHPSLKVRGRTARFQVPQGGSFCLLRVSFQAHSKYCKKRLQAVPIPASERPQIHTYYKLNDIIYRSEES